MITQLKLEFPEFESLEESEVLDGNSSLGWQVTAFRRTHIPQGSGFHSELNKARKIAIAEFIEREFVEKLRSSNERHLWDFDKYPSACGFASGFDLPNTKLRSICEALERWAMAQWIDSGCELEEVLNAQYSRPTQFFTKDFSSVRLFRKTFAYGFDGTVLKLELCVLVGFTKHGAFIGSAVRTAFDEALEHAALESNRHLIIARQERDFTRFPYNRIKYFAQNSDSVVKVLAKPRTTKWPSIKIRFQREHLSDVYCIVRTVCDGWEPWHSGSIDRLLY